MKRFLAPVVAACLALGGYVLWTSTQGMPQSTQAEQLLGAANAQTTAEEIDTSSIQEMQLGDADAPVTLIEYASYTCPHCARFHEGPFKQLKTNYIDTGKINFVYREVYFDRFGLWASAIARCAGTPESFFGSSDLVYETQSEWTRAGGGDPAAIVEELRKIGRIAGLGNEALESCLQDGDKLRTLVAWYQQNAAADDVSSTPTLLINGVKHGNLGYSEIARLIDEALGS